MSTIQWAAAYICVWPWGFPGRCEVCMLAASADEGDEPDQKWQKAVSLRADSLQRWGTVGVAGWQRWS